MKLISNFNKWSASFFQSRIGKIIPKWLMGISLLSTKFVETNLVLFFGDSRCAVSWWPKKLKSTQSFDSRPTVQFKNLIYQILVSFKLLTGIAKWNGRKFLIMYLGYFYNPNIFRNHLNDPLDSSFSENAYVVLLFSVLTIWLLVVIFLS